MIEETHSCKTCLECGFHYLKKTEQFQDRCFYYKEVILNPYEKPKACKVDGMIIVKKED